MSKKIEKRKKRNILESLNRLRSRRVRKGKKPKNRNRVVPRTARKSEKAKRRRKPIRNRGIIKMVDCPILIKPYILITRRKVF